MGRHFNLKSFYRIPREQSRWVSGVGAEQLGANASAGWRSATGARVGIGTALGADRSGIQKFTNPESGGSSARNDAVAVQSRRRLTSPRATRTMCRAFGARDTSIGSEF